MTFFMKSEHEPGDTLSVCASDWDIVEACAVIRGLYLANERSSRADTLVIDTLETGMRIFALTMDLAVEDMAVAGTRPNIGAIRSAW